MPYLTEALPLPDPVFQLLRDLIQERLGLHYDVSRKDVLQDRLAPLVAEQNLSSFMDYYYLLRYADDRHQEWRRVQSALAVRETYFWREFDPIRLAAEQIVPQLLQRFPGRPVRIWHAACSSGEEPYSMAMALEEAGGFAQGLVEVIGTDFDEEALAQARQGVFRERSFRVLPESLRQKYFSTHVNGTWKLADSIRQRVQFAYLNLVDFPALRAMPTCDVIFCRNAFIYFDHATVQKVANEFYRVLREPGYLFLGAAESLLRVQTPFELAEMSGCFVYCKSVA